uniref:Major facilitator superfamily (MFS) profile domain-containing protein n=1 Tax=Ciona savignyi TaxID=51511 RepID=H2YBH4_CIOSA
MLLLAASVRHTASFCWAYNTQLYFNHYFPGTDVGLWMTVCSIVGGTIGIATGGIISDLVVSRYGMRTRLWVLVISQGIAAPLAAMVLYLEPPYCFVSLMAAYLFAEMWFGVLFTVLVEIFPRKMCSTAIAIFIFVINNVASNGQLTVPVLKPILGFRNTLCITYVGFYAASSFLFLLTQLLLLRESKKENVVLKESSSKIADSPLSPAVSV